MECQEVNGPFHDVCQPDGVPLAAADVALLSRRLCAAHGSASNACPDGADGPRHLCLGTPALPGFWSLTQHALAPQRVPAPSRVCCPCQPALSVLVGPRLAASCSRLPLPPCWCAPRRWPSCGAGSSSSRNKRCGAAAVQCVAGSLSQRHACLMSLESWRQSHACGTSELNSVACLWYLRRGWRERRLLYPLPPSAGGVCEAQSGSSGAPGLLRCNREAQPRGKRKSGSKHRKCHRKGA